MIILDDSETEPGESVVKLVFGAINLKWSHIFKYQSKTLTKILCVICVAIVGEPLYYATMLKNLEIERILALIDDKMAKKEVKE